MNVEHYILLFLTSGAACLLLTPAIIKASVAFGLVDKPQTVQVTLRRKIHSSPTPRLGGGAIFLAYILSFYLWSPPFQSNYFLYCTSAIFLLGFADDVFQLSATTRLVYQVAVSLILTYGLQLAPEQMSILPGQSFALPIWLGYALAVLILVGAINAVNMIDGLDGLAGGVIFISLILLTYVHFFTTQRYTIFYISLPLLGGLLGFLRYNAFPARIFLGDGGSYWLGFTCGILFLTALSQDGFYRTNDVIALSSFSSHELTIVSLILCMAIPIFDTAFVIIRRVLSKQNPMRADNRHFHHNLLRMGLTQSQSVGLIYFISLVVGICAIAPLAYPRNFTLWIPHITCALIILIIFLASVAPNELLNRVGRGTSPSHHQVSHLVKRYISLVIENLNRGLLYIILLGVPITSGRTTPLIGYIAAGFSILLIFTKFINKTRNDFLANSILYMGCAMLLIANNLNPITVVLTNTKYQLQDIYNFSFILLFISSLLYVIINIQKKYFMVSPSSFLLMVIPMLMLVVPEPLRSEYRLNIISMRCLVIFFAIQILTQTRVTNFHKLRFACALSLIFMALFGIYGLKINS